MVCEVKTSQSLKSSILFKGKIDIEFELFCLKHAPNTKNGGNVRHSSFRKATQLGVINQLFYGIFSLADRLLCLAFDFLREALCA